MREWEAYWSVEPFGYVRHDLHAAGIAHMIAAVNHDRKKKPLPGLDAFMICPEQAESKPQSQKDQMRIINALCKAVNKDNEKKSL